MEEARYVQPGSPILASQHNALVDAVGGQLNSSPDLQFTRTGGGTIYSANNNFNDLPQSKMDALFEISYAAGELDDRYSAWNQAKDDNGFRGIWLKVVNYVKNRQFFYHTQFFPQLNWLINIDPTDQSGKLIWQMPGAVEDDSFQLPLCTADKAASMLVLLVDRLNDNASGSSQAMLGCTVSIVGDWSPWLDEEEANPGEAWAAWYSHQLDLTIKLKAVCPALVDVASFRIVGQYQLYDNFKTEITQDWHFDPVTLNIGQQHIESMPDSSMAAAAMLSTAQLSSIEFTTAKQFGYPVGAPTFSYSLFNFEKLKSDISNLSSIKGQLSSYDVLVKHKTPNEKVAGNCKADLQYLALSTLLGTVDSEISSLHLSSVQTGTWTDPDTGEDTKYHQFFGFAEQGLNNYELSDGLDVVVRDYHTTGGIGARVNYLSLSGLASKLSSNVSVDTWATQGAQRSIDWKTQSNNKYLQLYNFDNNGYEDALRVNLAYGQHRYATKEGSGEYPDPYVEFVVRDRSGARMVKYDALDIYAPPISASDITDLCSVISTIVDHECSCDIGPLSAKVDQLSSQLSNYWKVGGTYDDNCYGQSIGDDSQNPQIDLNNGQLLYSNELDPTVDWHNGYLSWNNGELRLDWCNCIAYDTSQVQSIDWDSRMLKDSGGMPTVEWDTKALNGDYGVAVDWQNHMLVPTGGSPTVEWANCILDDLNQSQSLDWNNRELVGDWSCPYGDFSIGSGFTLKIGNTTITEAQLQQLLALLQVVPNALQGV